MQDPVQTCQVGCCVDVTLDNGVSEKRVLDLGQSIASPTDSCDIYVCEVCYAHVAAAYTALISFVAPVICSSLDSLTIKLMSVP